MQEQYESLLSVIENKFGTELVNFKGCEIGVWTGNDSKELLKNFPTLYLYMIDPWLPEHILGSMKVSKSIKTTSHHYRHACKITEFAASRRLVMRTTSMEAISDFENESLHFVFIDGNHTYKYVKQDMRWWAKIKPGGLMIGHDYNGRMEKRGKWGVKKAVDRFAKRNKLTVNVHSELMFSIEK